MARLPTTDLYFRNAMDPWISRWWRRGPIRRVGANAFVAGEWFVLVRQDKPLVMREALAWHGRLAYVIDDDIAAGTVCEHLPETYRAKLAEFDRRFHRDLLARADVVLAASDILAESLARSPRLADRLQRIEPAWRLPLANLDHFADLEQGTSIKIAMLGSGSHRAALEAIAPALEDLLDRYKQVQLTYLARRRVTDRLEHHPRARRIEPMTWPEYQRWLVRQRFHLALYPLLPSPFERARSSNKLTEHAVVGALGVYPQSWAPARRLGEAAVSAPENPAEWGILIEKLIANPTEISQLAQLNLQNLSCENPLAMQQELWFNLLGLFVQ
jgi:hypothetical protein